jgi:hypothetical protein
VKGLYRARQILLLSGLVLALLGSACGLSQQNRSSNVATAAQTSQSGKAAQPTNQSTTTAQATSQSGTEAPASAHGTHGPEMLTKDQLEAEVAAQKRVATFFHDKVTPHLRSCWGSLKGTGDIRMEYTFARRDNTWIPAEVILAHSTMPDDQNDAALKCMERAVKDASLPIDYTDGNTQKFFISWSWPVPFPKDAEYQYQMMLTSTGGGGKWGCDGRGTPAKCRRCVSSGSSSCCVTVCVGYVSCDFSRAGGKVIGCFNDPPTQCVSGGETGVSGGLIIF